MYTKAHHIFSFFHVLHCLRIHSLFEYNKSLCENVGSARSVDRNSKIYIYIYKYIIQYTDISAVHFPVRSTMTLRTTDSENPKKLVLTIGDKILKKEKDQGTTSYAILSTNTSSY